MSVECPIDIQLADSHLIVRLPGVHTTLSWALVGGGLRESEAVVWKEIRNRDLGPNVDPIALLASELAAVGLPDATGLLTSAPLRDYEFSVETLGGMCAVAIATVGLANALTVGDAPSIEPTEYGTINVVVWLSVGLSEAATVEALSIATEARTSAVVDAKVPSRVSGLVATGTGTDCIVVASPRNGSEAYAGKHTVVGSLIGLATYKAVTDGIKRWRKRRVRG